MRLFRPQKPLHERLLEEAGLGQERPPHDVRPRWGETGIHGLHRPREFDVVTTTEAPEIEGERVAFVALPDGSLLVEEERGDAQLDPLAAAVEGELEAPYRAIAANHGNGVWAVSARRIDVVELEAAGDELELAMHDGTRTLRVDGEESFGSLPTLERVGRGLGESYVVRASRLDGSLWEVEATPL